MENNKRINLILQGGGVKGLSYIGAIRYLEEEKYEFEYIAGTSVGALIGSLLAVGYDSYELENIINRVPYNIFLTKNNPQEVIKNKGLYSTLPIEKYIDNLFLKKNKRVFGDIKIGNNYKVIIIATSLNYQRIFVLPYDLKLLNINPDTFPISKAVAMSISIPFFYEPYKIGKYIFYDGGLSDNYPKWCFSKGIALKVSNDKNYFTNISKKVFGHIENKNDIKEVYINTKGFKATDFKKGFYHKYDLYNKGYYTMKHFIEEQPQK